MYDAASGVVCTVEKQRGHSPSLCRSQRLEGARTDTSNAEARRQKAQEDLAAINTVRSHHSGAQLPALSLLLLLTCWLVVDESASPGHASCAVGAEQAG